MPRPGEPDYYRSRARAEGYVARAVYKLKEVDEKYRLLKPGQRVLDLGCSPGSWLQYIASRVGPGGLVGGGAGGRRLLREGVHFLVKFLEGPDTPALAAVLKQNFSLCRSIKPAGSRPASR